MEENRARRKGSWQLLSFLLMGFFVACLLCLLALEGNLESDSALQAWVSTHQREE